MNKTSLLLILTLCTLAVSTLVWGVATRTKKSTPEQPNVAQATTLSQTDVSPRTGKLLAQTVSQPLPNPPVDTPSRSTQNSQTSMPTIPVPPSISNQIARTTPESGFSKTPTTSPTGATAPVTPAPAFPTGQLNSVAFFNSKLAFQSTEQEVAVPFGAQLPAAIVDEGSQLQPAQTAAVDAIADGFVDAVTQGGAATGTETGSQAGALQERGLSPSAIWDRAREEADSRYRVLFGDSAYNTYTISARIEAIAEQK